MMETVVTTGAINRAKLQSNHHHQQTITQFFNKVDALPVARPIVSKTEWKTEGNYSIKIQATSKFMLNSSPENGNVDNF